MTFLVVEGSETARKAISIALLPHGIKGLPVPDRLGAWEALRADSSIRGAVVDVDDKAVDGARLVEEIKADERVRGISVIAHTAQASRGFVMRMIETGVAGFLLGAYNASTGPARVERALARLADHHQQRRHLRVKPDPGEMVRVSFRLPGAAALIAGRVVDISLGGMAVELLNPPSEGLPGAGVRIATLSIALTGRELSPAGTVVSAQGRALALRFEALDAADKAALERYIYRRISA